MEYIVIAFQGKRIQCVGFGTTFTFTAFEQGHLTNTGFTNEAKALPRLPETRDDIVAVCILPSYQQRS
jgi:hypothetical protein